jgi:hypothetical protein
LEALATLQVRTGRQMEAIATMNAGLDEHKKPDIKQNILKKLFDQYFRMFLKIGR